MGSLSPRVAPDADSMAPSPPEEQFQPIYQAGLVDPQQAFTGLLDHKPLIGSLYQPLSQQQPRTLSQPPAIGTLTKETPLPAPSHQPTLYSQYLPNGQVELSQGPQSQAPQKAPGVPANTCNTSEQGPNNAATDGHVDFEYFDLDHLDFDDVDLQGVNMSTEEIDAILNTSIDVMLSSRSDGYTGTISSADAPQLVAQQVPSTTHTSPIFSLVPAGTHHEDRDGTIYNQASGDGNLGGDAVDESSEDTGSALWEPSEAVDSITLEFDTEQKYLEYLRSRKESRLVDASLPRTWAEKAQHVLRLKKAMVDISKAEDSRSASFIKRWRHPRAELYYIDIDIEALCWEIVNKAVNLHLHGPGILDCHDPGHSKKYRSGMQLAFQERMDKMVEYVLKSKARVDTLMKHDTLDTFIAIPHKLIPASRANREFNGKRGLNIKAGKASRKANDPVSPASPEQDTAVPTNEIAATIIDNASGASETLQSSATDIQHTNMTTHNLGAVAQASAADDRELTASLSPTGQDPPTTRKKSLQQSLPSAEHQASAAVSLPEPRKAPYSTSASPVLSTTTSPRRSTLMPNVSRKRPADEEAQSTIQKSRKVSN